MQYLNNASAVKSSYMDLSAIGADSYFRQNQSEKRLTKQDLPSYTENYNKIYGDLKDIQMTTGQDFKSDGQAFYVVNAAEEADRKVKEIIANVEASNKAYEEQQKRIAEFTKQQGESQKNAIFEQYMSNLMSTQYKDLSRGYTNSNYSFFDQKKWNSTSAINKEVRYDTIMDSFGRKKTHTVRLYRLSEEEKKKQINIIRQVEQMRFTSDSSLQKRFAADYASLMETKQQNTEKQIKAIKNRIAALSKKK